MTGRVLVLGARGMLGVEVVRAANNAGYNVTALGSEYDIATYAVMYQQEERWRPHYVINCAGVIPQRAHAYNIAMPAVMVRVNAYGPWVVKKAFPHSKIIHVSTDCVFDGTIAGAPFRPYHRPNAADLYGRTKAMGEIDGAIVVRTSFIGPRHGLLGWLLSQPPGTTVDGWANAFWSGGTVYDVAEGLVMMLGYTNGIYHMAAEPIAKATLIRQLIDVLDLPLEVRDVDTPCINRILTANFRIGRRLERLVSDAPCISRNTSRA